MEKSVRFCDLDDRLATETITVVVDGTARNLDVCDDHLTWAEGLPPQRASTPAATRTRRAAQTKKTPKPASAGRQPGSRRAMQSERAAVREWARLQGREVGDRGRLPSGLIDEYKASTAGA